MKRKPWGDCGHYCPVALKEKGVLWPGSHDLAVRYRDKLYCFSSKASKEMFEKTPKLYTASDNPLQVHFGFEICNIVCVVLYKCD